MLKLHLRKTKISESPAAAPYSDPLGSPVLAATILVLVLLASSSAVVMSNQGLRAEIISAAKHILDNPSSQDRRTAKPTPNKPRADLEAAQVTEEKGDQLPAPVSAGATTNIAPTTPTAPSTPKPQVAHGTPEIAYGWQFLDADPNSSACSFQVVVKVIANAWHGYSTGEIVVNMTLHSYYGTYPYTTTYAMSPGETKVFTKDFSFPTHPNGDGVTATVNVTAAGAGAGEAMLINNSLPSDDPSIGWNCF